jgi:hypothetical protein
MFLKEKCLANGDFEKLKARLGAAGGHLQDRNVYTETASPTIMTQSVFGSLER